jgi:hypothetical protein
MSGYRSPFPFLADEHMRLVGIIAFHWETIDLTMQRVIAEVMGFTLGQVGLFTDNISFRTKQDMLMSYARHLQTEAPELWQEFTQAMEAVKKANTLRNTYVHAKWHDGPQPGTPTRTAVHTRDGRFTLVDEPVPIADLEKAADDIFKAGEKLLTFFQKFDVMTS